MPWQVVGELDPGQPLAPMDMELRGEVRRVLEAGRVEVDLVGIAVLLEGHRRAAGGAEHPAGAGGGVVDARRLAGEAIGLLRHAEPGREGRRGVPATALAMAMGAPALRPA